MISKIGETRIKINPKIEITWEVTSFDDPNEGSLVLHEKLVAQTPTFGKNVILVSLPDSHVGQ